MTENPKKKPLIIESSDDESSIPSELDIPVENIEDLNPSSLVKQKLDILPPSSDASSSSTGKSLLQPAVSSDSSSSSTGI